MHSFALKLKFWFSFFLDLNCQIWALQLSMSFTQQLQNILGFNLFLFIINLRNNTEIYGQGMFQKFHLNIKSDLKSMKTKITTVLTCQYILHNVWHYTFTLIFHVLIKYYSQFFSNCVKRKCLILSCKISKHSYQVLRILKICTKPLSFTKKNEFLS